MSSQENDYLSKLEGHCSLTDRVHERIRKPIYSLAIKAGEQIQEVKLARKPGTGGTSVREALHNDELHQRIPSLSGNRLLVQMMATIENINRLCVSSTVMIPGRSQQAIKEHRGLVELLAKKDARGAQELMSRHIQLAKEAFLKSHREEVLNRETVGP